MDLGMLMGRLSDQAMVECGQGKGAEKAMASRMTPGSQSEGLKKWKLSNPQQ